MNPFGINVLTQPHIDRAALLAWVDRAKPALMLVMDDAALAQDIKARLPKSIVVHRSYAPHDMRWHEVVTPKEFLDAHAPTAANGVVCQVFNEPGGSALFAATTWIEQLIAQCPPTMTLALPNLGVGNPAEDEILAGKFDRILKAICGTRHFWALHEYFVTDPLRETPYLCGRFTFWQRRARQLGLPAPKIIITEHGRDVGGGQTDGWRDTGWSEDQYFARLVQARELYKPYGIPVAVYGYGAGFSQRWQSFNVEGAATLLDKMAKYQEQLPVIDIPAPTTGGVKSKLTKIPGDFINVRHQPNGNDVGDLLVGDVVTYYPDAPVIAGGSQWVYQSPLDPIARPTGRQNAAVGWVSLQDGKVVFEKVVDPPPAEPEPETEPQTITLTIDQYNTLVASLSIAQRILATVAVAPAPVPVPLLPFDAIDVSQAQEVIDWQAVAKSGVRAAYIRATQGTSQIDTRFVENAQKAAAAGIAIGFYHPLIASQNGVSQAEHFLNQIKPYDWLIPPAIDVELDNDQTPTRIADELYAMATKIEAAIGKRPVIYTSWGFWNGKVGNQHDSYFAECPLWVANYTSAPKPMIPRCWSDYWLWQYTSSGKVDGIAGRVDLNRRAAQALVLVAA